MATIDVLLATYNGARYLPEQLASLEAQSFADWRLILRDDGSSDGSVEIVRAWAGRTGRDLVVIEDGRGGLGAKDNFGALMEASDAPYFACCDQDDVWLPEKLAVMLKAVREAEARLGAETPVLAYSDLRVVDAELREISPSFWDYAGLHRPQAGRELIGLMTQNVVAGCASLGNQAVRLAALPIPAEAVMHDWWLALVVAAAGELVEIAQPTVEYRQHGRNASRPIDWSPRGVLTSALRNPGTTLRRGRAFGRDSQIQALALQHHLAASAAPSVVESIAAYGALADRPFLIRKLYTLRHPPRGGSKMRRMVIALCM